MCTINYDKALERVQ